MLLSVVVPVYNTEAYLARCIKSILSQSLSDFELILVDDGSTDSSLSICNDYKKYVNVKILHQKNAGIVGARKRGLSETKGKYIAFVDSDDWIESNMFERMMEEIKKYDADIVCCGNYYDSGEKSRICRCCKRTEIYDKLRLKKELYDGILAYGFDWDQKRKIVPHVVDKIFRREIVELVYDKIDTDLSLGEDVITTCSAFLEAKKVIMIPDILYHYCINDNSVTQRKNSKIVNDFSKTLNELIKISQRNENVLDRQIPYYAFALSRIVLNVGFGVDSRKVYKFPLQLLSFRRLLIYGAGVVGNCYYEQARNMNTFESVWLTDSNKKLENDYFVCPEDAVKNNFDIVVVAIENKAVADAIVERLKDLNVPESKIYWEEPKCYEDVYQYEVKSYNN